MRESTKSLDVRSLPIAAEDTEGITELAVLAAAVTTCGLRGGSRDHLSRCDSDWGRGDKLGSDHLRRRRARVTAGKDAVHEIGLRC